MATADGVRVYDDFAHHPTAVRETLRGLRARHPEGRLIALFEPRSATASRKLHQDAYAAAFEAADLALLAPVGRKEIAEGERLDVAQIARAHRGRAASAPWRPQTTTRSSRCCSTRRGRAIPSWPCPTETLRASSTA